MCMTLFSRGERNLNFFRFKSLAAGAQDDGKAREKRVRRLFPAPSPPERGKTLLIRRKFALLTASKAALEFHLVC